MRMKWKGLLAHMSENDIPIYALECPDSRKAQSARRAVTQYYDLFEMNMDAFTRGNTFYIINRNALGLGSINAWV